MDDLPEEIRGHAPYVENIRRWCSDWISEETFDRLANTPSLEGDVVATHYEPGTILLPHHHGEQQCYLAVLQSMMRHGLIEAERRDDLIWYRAT